MPEESFIEGQDDLIFGRLNVKSEDSNGSSSAFVIRQNSNDKSLCTVGLAKSKLKSNNREQKFTVEEHKIFNQIWSVQSDISVPSVNFEIVNQKVKARAQQPLVSQPQNLRMRLSPFNTPNAKKIKKAKK